MYFKQIRNEQDEFGNRAESIEYLKTFTNSMKRSEKPRIVMKKRTGRKRTKENRVLTQRLCNGDLISSTAFR